MEATHIRRLFTCIVLFFYQHKISQKFISIRFHKNVFAKRMHEHIYTYKK